jgi:Uncharacterized Fe-S protein
MSSAVPIELGAVVSLWRYPVKSMMGEELNATEVTERGLLGDRAYALVDSSDGKAATAKNPRKWPRLFDFRATFIEPARPAAKVPPVRIALPDGTTVTSDQSDLNRILSKTLNREVTFRAAQRGAVNAEEYWPDMEGLDHRDTVTDFTLPEGTFFDVAVVHLLTTARSIASVSCTRKATSRSGGFVQTSWCSWAQVRRALRRMPGSDTRSPSGRRCA